MILGLRDYKDHSSPRVWSCLATFTTLPSNVFLFRLKKIREIEFQFHEIFNICLHLFVYFYRYSRDPQTMATELHFSVSLGSRPASQQAAWEDLNFGANDLKFNQFSREASASPPYGVTYC